MNQSCIDENIFESINPGNHKHIKSHESSGILS